MAGRSVSFASFFAEFAVFGWIFLRVLWHPRFRIGAACVAPVWGGTYFSLQRQRKVGKRKPLHTSGACQVRAAPCRS
ncbi:hypothetical protein PSAB6_70221 [Paraburkholderia sabiae]|nr:hypothetical protein PSAB6_70221 [Paraburkholderia sabiae]